MWRDSCNSNLRHIDSNDLYVPVNTYSTGGRNIRVVSTSQLEGFHAGLKKLVARPVSARLGLRILDIFIVQHILRIEAEFGRNPDFGALDFVSLAQAAIWSRGALPASPQLSFGLHILSEQLEGPQYRSASSSTSVATKKLDKNTFMASLNLHENSYEPSAGFTAQEYELLRQI
ncbi:hypothetical protein L915_21058 [Phytophthora nicotianae]|uniref:Uncharacterized protein n=1 Tax=Phytophthora nicotianae TaxID=4792 RepID=W2FM38_PHYNI|nr:hypothetical protein L915_21058 [Phytophthora nicotianae]